MQVANFYQEQAIANCGSSRKDEVIAFCKANGLEQEIQTRLKAVVPIPKHLAYLEGEERNAYLHDMGVCAKYAQASRELIASEVLKVCNLSEVDKFHTVHNHIDLEDNMVRKGAISAKLGEKVLIPISMAFGCILGVGKGNEDYNCSAPHGAGRKLSRAKAKNSLDLEEFKGAMEGVYSSCVDLERLDEAPMAYKDPNDILEGLGETVEVLDILKPIYNFKAK